MNIAKALLESKLREGYCLHGSRHRLEVIDPQQARCNTGRPEGCLYAVYADPNGWAIPCLMALMSPIDPRLGCFTSYSKEGNGPLRVRGEGATFAPGYVYVLPKQTFETINGEFISRVSVGPHLTVLVNPDILSYILDLQCEIPIPAEW